MKSIAFLLFLVTACTAEELELSVKVAEDVAEYVETKEKQANEIWDVELNKRQYPKKPSKQKRWWDYGDKKGKSR